MKLLFKAHVKAHTRMDRYGKVSLVRDHERRGRPKNMAQEHQSIMAKTGKTPYDVELHGIKEDAGKVYRFNDLNRAMSKIISYKDEDMPATIYHGSSKMTLPVKSWVSIHKEDFGLFGEKPSFEEIIKRHGGSLSQADRARFARLTEPQHKQMGLFGKGRVWIYMESRKIQSPL